MAPWVNGAMAFYNQFSACKVPSVLSPHTVSGKTVYCLPLVLERKEITFFFLSSLPSVTSLFALLL